MAHERKRHVKALYQKHLSFSPIVGIFGHRQVGKSTFIAKEVSEYVTLDEEIELSKASENPKDFISNRKSPFAIDECQQEPKLFPALKEWVRVNKKTGQFVLSGSVRFTSRKAIRESLAGRMAFFEILPFSVSEIRSEDLPNTIPQLMEHRIFSQNTVSLLRSKNELSSVKKDFETYLHHGGLPGICFIREKQHRVEAVQFLHQLIIDRDIRMILPTKLSVLTMVKFLRWIASNSGNRHSYSEVKKKLGLASQTQKNILYAMESVFLIRRIPLKGQKGELILLEDQIEELILSEEKLSNDLQLETALYRNIRTQFFYRMGLQAQFESYRTRDGARIPIVIQTPNCTLGVMIVQGAEPNISEKRIAAGFLGKFQSSKVIYASKELIDPRVITDNSILLSLYSII